MWKGLAAGVLAVGVAVAGVVPTAAGATRPPQEDFGLLDTAVPAGVRVGAPHTNFTVTVVTGAPMSEMQSLMVDDRGTQVGVCFADTWQTGRGRNVFKPYCGFPSDALTHWGEYRLLHRAVSLVEVVTTKVATGSSVVEVKAHSMLGLAAGRDGATTRLRGSARAYHSVEDRYVGWSGRQVSVQRRDGDAWVQVAAATTDARGNFTTSTSRLPAGSRLRAVVTDSPTIWGAVSAVVPA